MATETDAVWSNGVFDLGWSAPVRTLDNDVLQGWRAAEPPIAGARPGEGDVVGHRSDGEPVLTYDFAPTLTGMTGDLAAMANYAGQSVGLVGRQQAAADIVRDVAAEAERVLRTLTHVRR